MLSSKSVDSQQLKNVFHCTAFSKKAVCGGEIIATFVMEFFNFPVGSETCTLLVNVET